MSETGHFNTKLFRYITSSSHFNTNPSSEIALKLRSLQVWFASKQEKYFG